MPLRDVEYQLSFPSLRKVHFHHNEHLECLLFEELALHLEDLPLNDYCDHDDALIDHRTLVDLQVAAIFPESMVGTFLVTFAETIVHPSVDTVYHGYIFAFLFEHASGRLRFRSRLAETQR